MLAVLRNPTYFRLFGAQIIALLGTGLATVALSLLAYDLAGADAAAVLGTALAIKMVANVVIAPMATAMLDRIPRRAVLVSMDLVRAAAAMALPLVSEVWQVFVVIFLLQSASAVFTPTFQATIPEILPAERDYTRALSLSRLAYDLESLLSPAVAAGLLMLVTYNWLFWGTTVGFVASAFLVVSVVLPKPASTRHRGGIYAKTTRGVRLYLATPRLRALLALNLTVAAASAMVIINTVVLVRDQLGRTAVDVSITLAACGAGSMLMALLLPKLLRKWDDRQVMLPAAFILAAVLLLLTLGLASGLLSWPTLLALWAMLGAATSAILTPTGRLIRRSATSSDLPAAFAAQFSLSHSCWLLTYPLAGWLATGAGMTIAATTITVTAFAAALAALSLWPTPDPTQIAHFHNNLRPDHPHITDANTIANGWKHTHDYVIDTEHPHWPNQHHAVSRR